MAQDAVRHPDVFPLDRNIITTVHGSDRFIHRISQRHFIGANGLPQTRKEIVAWVGSHVLPHEGDVRRWLGRFVTDAADADDVIQEAYCRIAALESVAHIDSARAYLFQTARHIALEHIRRSRIVRIDSVTDIELLRIVDDGPSPERILAGSRQLEQVRALIEGLPSKCREIFVLRRVHGVSQKEIARELGVSENTVEMHAKRGLKMILRALEREGLSADEKLSGGSHGQSQQRTRD
jgi:RNA polymerase sigma factor (sigma-70 family)